MPLTQLSLKRCHRGTSLVEGFSLLEMLLALFVFTVGLLSVLPLMTLATRQNELSQHQTAAAILAQRHLEQISYHAFTAAGSFFDGDGNWIQVSCPDPAQESCGNPLNTVGLIDFSRTAPPGFSLTYQDPRGASYDVRWNIRVTPSNTKQIAIGVRTRTAIFNVPPVHLRTLVAP